MIDENDSAGDMVIVECGEGEYGALAQIWERSVRATHGFLTEEAIREIGREIVPVYFPAVRLFAALERGRHVAFIGLSGDKIEMLFVDSDRLGAGLGSALVKFAMERGATCVDVNEQNGQALGFYLSKGFRVVGRDEADDAGRPYPVLHLSL